MSVQLGIDRPLTLSAAVVTTRRQLSYHEIPGAFPYLRSSFKNIVTRPPLAPAAQHPRALSPRNFTMSPFRAAGQDEWRTSVARTIPFGLGKIAKTTSC